jgi:antitoxin YefM
MKRRGGRDSSVASVEDREREQETRYVLENKSLMAQIERSLKTHAEGKGRRVSADGLDALDCILG